MRSESGKETFWKQTWIEELEILDASQTRARRLNAKQHITPKNGENFIFPIADRTVKLSGEYQVFPKVPTLIRDQPERGEELKR